MLATHMYDLGGEVDLIHTLGIGLDACFKLDLRAELQYSLGPSVVSIKIGLRDELG